jgi:RNA polymerase sigma factor (sigma-70 family)
MKDDLNPLRRSLQHAIHQVSRLSRAGDLDELTDSQLLDAFIGETDQDAFASLLRRHGPMVLSVCRRVLHDHHLAEDAFQAAFLVLVRKARSIANRPSVGSWLFQVAHRIALRARINADRRRVRQTEVVDMPQEDPKLADVCAEHRKLLDEEIRHLPEKYRGPVVLCYLEGKTTQEAARQLGCPFGTIASRLARSRDLLRRRLERRGVMLSAAGFSGLLAEQVAEGAVSPALFDRTMDMANLLTTGAPVASSLSQEAIILAEGMMKAMLITRLQWIAAFVLLASLLGGGAAMLGSHVLAPRVVEAAELEPAPLTDLHGDPLPPGALARVGTVRFRHNYRSRSLVFSPGGKTLADSTAGVVNLFDVANGKAERKTCALGFHAPEGAAAFAADGTILAAGSGRWDAKSGSASHTVELWDVTTGKVLHGFVGHQEGVTVIAFSRDVKMLASADLGGTIRVWEIARRKAICTWAGKRAHSLVFSPDGNILAAGYLDGVIGLWDMAKGQEVRQLPIKPALVQIPPAIAFSPDGKTLASGSYDKLIRIWDVAKGTAVQTLTGSTGPVSAVAFSPDGKTLASGDADSAVLLWDVGTGKKTHSLDVQNGPATALAFSPDGKTLASADRYAVRLWDPATGREVSPRSGHQSEVNGVALSPDGTIIASASSDRTIRLSEAATGREIRRLTGHERPVFSLRFSPDGKTLVSSAQDRTVRVWDVSRGVQVHSLGHEGQVAILAPDGKTLLSISAQYLRRLDIRTGKEISRSAGPATIGGASVCSPDGKWLALGIDRAILVWDTATTRERRLTGHEAHANVVAFSPDRLLASGSADKTIRLWDVTTGTTRHVLAGHGCWVTALAFSPDGRTLASGDECGSVLLWEVATGKRIRAFSGHLTWITSLAFSADGRTLVSGSQDTTAMLWDLTGWGPGRRPPALKLGTQELSGLWDELAGDTTAKAFRAIWALTAAPHDAVPLFQRHLRPVQRADPQRLAQLVAALDSDRFAVRADAEKELERLGELAWPALRQSLQEKPSVEQRQRLERLLATAPTWSPEQLRMLRAMTVLEQINSPEAKQLLEKLAQGTPEARLTQQAKATLERLARSSLAPLPR